MSPAASAALGGLWTSKPRRGAVRAESTVATQVPVIPKSAATKAVIGEAAHLAWIHLAWPMPYTGPPPCAAEAIKGSLLFQDLPSAALDVIIDSMSSISVQAKADIIKQVTHHMLTHHMLVCNTLTRNRLGWRCLDRTPHQLNVLPPERTG